VKCKTNGVPHYPLILNLPIVSVTLEQIIIFMDILPNTIVGGHYRIIKMLGKGGFGETYLARNSHAQDSECAVKRFKPDSQNQAVFNKAKELFEREASILLSITNREPRNANIPRFLAYFDEGQEFYLVQEFIEGDTLAQELSKKNRFTEEEVCQLLEELLKVLQFLHSQNPKIIHRDIKPENLIRRASDKRLFLIDFGAVKEVVTQSGNRGIQAGTAISSEGYTPPEQMNGNPQPNSDIYALGMTALQCLTGSAPGEFRVPVTGENTVWPPPAFLLRKKALLAIIEKMTHQDYRRGRYQSADEVLADLDDFRRTRIESYIEPKNHSLVQIVNSLPLPIKFSLVPIASLLIFCVFFTISKLIVVKQPIITPSSNPPTEQTIEPTRTPQPSDNCGVFRSPGDKCPQ
jgi:eukaryotic-like serine/threonine-protein kinase